MIRVEGGFAQGKLKPDGRKLEGIARELRAQANEFPGAAMRHRDVPFRWRVVSSKPERSRKGLRLRPDCRKARFLCGPALTAAAATSRDIVYEAITTAIVDPAAELVAELAGVEVGFGYGSRAKLIGVALELVAAGDGAVADPRDKPEGRRRSAFRWG